MRKSIMIFFLVVILLSLSVLAFLKMNNIDKTPKIKFSIAATCGNHKIEFGEQCDPPLQPISYSCPSTGKFCNHECKCQSLCGNGIIEPGEECDSSKDCMPYVCVLRKTYVTRFYK